MSSASQGTAQAKTFAYRLFTHCGVTSITLHGRLYYVAAVDPWSVTAGLTNPEDDGSMTVVSEHELRFSDPQGNVVPFTDQPPGTVGVAYPFRIHIHSGGDAIMDVAFAGRRWHATGTLPGVHGLAYGNGEDRSSDVDGTMTLLQSGDAVFRTASGASVTFLQVPEPIGCD